MTTAYQYRPADRLFCAVLTARTGDGVRAGIISGAPGVGKTALAYALAESVGGAVVYSLAHHWTSDEDLFVRLDPARVAGVVAGKVDDIASSYQPGALMRAAVASQDGPTVLVLDEWDKAPERADALLLDFLQSGEVRDPFGVVTRANSAQLFVVITTNGARELSEPLQRRAYRYEMGYLAPETERDIIRKRTGCKPGVARVIVAALAAVRAGGDSSPSLQEGVRLAESLALAADAASVDLLVAGFITKTAADRAALDKAIPHVGAALHGEARRA